MRTRKRFVHELVIGIAMFICMAGVLANPADSRAAAYSILHNFIGGTVDGYAALLRRPRPLRVHPLRDDPRWGQIHDQRHAL